CARWRRRTTKCGTVGWKDNLEKTCRSYRQGGDALDYLLNRVYHRSTGNAEDPIELEDIDDDLDNDADDGGVAGLQDNGGNDGESPPGRVEDGGGAEESEGGAPAVGGIKEEPAVGNQGSGDGAPSEDIEEADGGYPVRPDKWMHPYLLTDCLIGRPSSSEDPDLRTARKTSGPKGRGGKQESKRGSPGTSDESGSETSGAYTDVDLSSNATRMFAGAGESQSRAQVKKEHAAVAAANAQEQARRVQQTHTGKLVTAVEALSAAVVSRQALDEEASQRSRWDYARLAKKAKIDDLRGEVGVHTGRAKGDGTASPYIGLV
ncbi:unnamed protein product, partial [Ectocarpus sp. 6 AP-2014]